MKMNVGIACSSTAVSATSSSIQQPLLRVRREPFEYGLLTLSKLIFPDGINTLRALRGKLLNNSIAYPLHQSKTVVTEGSSFVTQGKRRINAAGIAASLELPEYHALLVLETLASILSDHGAASDPLARCPASDIDTVGADIDDLLLFLYIQNYKRPVPRPHRDAAAVADVWPSTSAFDGFLSTLSPVQVRSSRRTMPSQADEEAHQLAYVQKHLPAILALLVESADEDDTETQVLVLEKFNRLGFLFRAHEQGAEVIPLSQAAPFFANSDPDMPAAPVPLTQVLQWVAEHIHSASEHPEEKAFSKDNIVVDGNCPGADVAMFDASLSTCGPSGNHLSNGLYQRHKELHLEGLTFIDGVTKASVLKEEADIEGSSVVKVSNCHDCVVYVLAPLKYASVYGCSDSIVVLGAVGKVVRVEHCERVQIITTAVRICIANCRECSFYLGVNQRPLILGDNHNLQVAPYNTFYPKLESHLTKVGVDPAVNRWDNILTLGVVDPHDSLSHRARFADVPTEGATVLPPDRYMTFVIPRWSAGDTQHPLLTKANPFILPKAYLLAQQQRSKSVDVLRQTLKNVPIDEGRKRDLSNAIHVYFKEWLYASGNIRQLYDLQVGGLDPKAMD
eukprot:c28780_g1_i1 orf=642-2501(+)